MSDYYDDEFYLTDPEELLDLPPSSEQPSDLPFSTLGAWEAALPAPDAYV